jgi:hypothetical protein
LTSAPSRKWLYSLRPSVELIAALPSRAQAPRGTVQRHVLRSSRTVKVFGGQYTSGHPPAPAASHPQLTRCDAAHSCSSRSRPVASSVQSTDKSNVKNEVPPPPLSEVSCRPPLRHTAHRPASSDRLSPNPFACAAGTEMLSSVTSYCRASLERYRHWSARSAIRQVRRRVPPPRGRSAASSRRENARHGEKKDGIQHREPWVNSPS